MPNTVVVYNKKDQVKDSLKKKILSGRYTEGSKFFSQNEVADIFKVSHITAQLALAALVQEGLLTRSQGKGTFVTEAKPEISSKEVVGVAMNTGGHLYGPFSDILIRDLMQHKLFPLVVDIGHDGKTGYNRTEALIDKQPAFLVLDEGVVAPVTGKLFSLLKRYRGHTIFIHKFEGTEEPAGSYVLSDADEGSMLAAEHLISSGYRKIILYTCPPPNRNITMIEKGIRTVLKKQGLPEGTFGYWHDTEEKNLNEKDIRERLKREKSPVAVIGDQDSRLAPVYKAAEDMGLRIPEDLALVGWYNTPWCDKFHPHLTSVSIREDLMAKKVVEIITNKEMQGKKILVPPELVIRESTGRRVRQNSPVCHSRGLSRA